MNETDLMHEVMLDLSDKGYAVFRANVGKVRLHDGRFFDTGLPKGFSDLFAVKDGKIFFIETKMKPKKPTPEQLDFLKAMKERYGASGGVAYTIEEARKICGYIND